MLEPPVYESSLTKVTTPSAAANTVVPCGTIKSIAFFNLPVWAGYEVLSTLSILSFGTGSA